MQCMWYIHSFSWCNDDLGLKRDSDNDGVGQKSILTCITHESWPLAALLCKRFNDSTAIMMSTSFHSYMYFFYYICKGTKILVSHMYEYTLEGKNEWSDDSYGAHQLITIILVVESWMIPSTTIDISLYAQEYDYALLLLYLKVVHLIRRLVDIFILPIRTWWRSMWSCITFQILQEIHHQRISPRSSTRSFFACNPP